MLPPRRQRTPTLDDSDSVDQDAEWERLLRDAKAKLDRKDAELSRTRVEKAELEQRLSQVALAPAAPPPAPPKVDVDTDDPKALRFRSRWFRVVIPVGWLTAAAAGIGAPLAAAVQHFVRLQTEVAELRQVVVSLQAEVAELRQRRPPPAPSSSPRRSPFPTGGSP